MRNFVYSLMTDKKAGPLYEPLKWLLSGAAALYGVGLKVRSLFYRTGIWKSKKVPIKVISIGNLSLGGTGKTPFAITLVKMLRQETKKDASVLIRGYGWDEAALLKKNLPGSAILVGEDRFKSAHKAITLYKSDTAVLDDGFQHWELARDLDIVLINSRNPFGNKQLFPRGVLREPISSIRRADIVVFTKVDQKNCDLATLKTEMLSINPRLTFVEAKHRPTGMYDLRSKKPTELSHLNGKKVVLLSSIGDPRYFKQMARSLGSEVVAHLIFQDHHDYTKKDIDTIVRMCQSRTLDFLVTTEKDAVKLSRLGFQIGSYAVYVLIVDMEITNGREGLVARLHSLYSR